MKANKKIKSFRISHKAMSILKSKAKEYNTSMTELLELEALKHEHLLAIPLVPKQKPLRINYV